MRVITQDQFGGPEVLHLSEGPLPEPLTTEVRVRVRAAGLNPVDRKTRAGRGVARVIGPPPFVLGWDVSGTVDALGYGVTRLNVGDEVFGMPWFPRQAGAYAEFVTAPSRHFARKPERLSHEEAAGLPLAGLAALQSLVDTARLLRGQRVLIHAGAGGVGHLAVQIAHGLGAEVIATARSANHKLVYELGADQVVDYQTTAFEKAIEPVDVVLDLVGGDVTEKSFDVLQPMGLLILVASTASDGLKSMAASRNVRATGLMVEPDHAGLEKLAHMVQEGQLRVIVGERFELSEAATAHEVSERGPNIGKTVLIP